MNLLNELRFAPKDWHNYLRMNEKTYFILLEKVTPLIQKKDTVLRPSISAHERLTATLRYLASGRSYVDMKFSTIISPQALSNIIPETCRAIYKVLHKEFLKFPKTTQEWKDIANQFETRWNFPHCLGALDGKHVNIIPPDGSRSYYFNYKGDHSMVLLALVDANYRLIMADFGVNGRISDGGVLQHTRFFEKLDENRLHIPCAENVNNSNAKLPYVIVADDAFPLRTDMLTVTVNNS